MNTISGYIERITFASEETGWTVARLKEAGKADLTTVVGNLLAVTPGETVELIGRWVTDKKYGPQFRVESFQSVVPATVNGIEKYLGSGLIRGIGPKMARRLVESFGEQTLELIENDPDRLFEVDGFGKNRVAWVTEALVPRRNSNPAFAQCRSLQSTENRRPQDGFCEIVIYIILSDIRGFCYDPWLHMRYTIYQTGDLLG